MSQFKTPFFLVILLICSFSMSFTSTYFDVKFSTSAPAYFDVEFSTSAPIYFDVEFSTSKASAVEKTSAEKDSVKKDSTEKKSDKKDFAKKESEDLISEDFTSNDIFLNNILPSDIFSGSKENDTISNIVDSLLDNQARELDEIDLESQAITKYMATGIPELQSKTQKVDNEFRNIFLIYQSSKTFPTEVSILAKQNKRLGYEINSLYIPFEKTQTQVNLRLEQLNTLAENLKAMNTPSVSPMLKRVAALTKKL